MKIKNIDIPKEADNSDGLENIKMDKLSNVVLLAGKNGSGKTRILNKIFARLKVKPTMSDILDAEPRLMIDKRNLPSYERELKRLQKELLEANDFVQKEELQMEIRQYISTKENAIKRIKRDEFRVDWKEVETSEASDFYKSVQFVPKNLDLKDCNSFSPNDIINIATKANSIGTNDLTQSTFAKIQVVQNRWFNSTHQHSQVSNEEEESAITDYKKLEQIIELFLNTSIGRTIDGYATLFGFPLGNSNLSDGQKILLQFCIAIYSQETALSELILVLDEPENHLHPSVIIEIIEKIKLCVPNGQIWIATHSIPLLAHFDPSFIWYVEKGKIQHAGKIPGEVLKSLLGDDDEVAKLQDFISLPAQYATSRYAFESLLEPGVVLTDSNDPQSFQIKTDLLQLSKNGVLRVLDYGAGKGRLISNIVDLDEANQEKLIANMDYIAFDKFATDKKHCEESLIRAYSSCENRYFNDFNKLLSVYDKGSFDIVIMCNVLHEIDPKDWLKLFRKDGEISSLLSDNGLLLLVEDHQIPIGEKAYQKGFLVLDTPQLKELFKITEQDRDFTFTDKKGDGRLKAHQIPKRCLMQIDKDSRELAIKSMSNIAREKILEIRGKETNYQNGKLHGFWTQQFANAQLNLAEFTTE